jgi:hypothetical protein
MLQVVAPLLNLLHLKVVTINIVAGVAGFWSISSLHTMNAPLGIDRGLGANQKRP